MHTNTKLHIQPTKPQKNENKNLKKNTSIIAKILCSRNDDEKYSDCTS